MRKSSWTLLILLVGMAGLSSCGLVAGQQAAPQAQTAPTIPPAPEMASPPGEIVLQDGFAGKLSEMWAVLDAAQRPGEEARWYTQDGILAQGGTTRDRDSVESAYLVVNSGADWTDYTLQASIYVDGNDEVGLTFRVNDQGFYRFRMRSAEFDGPFQVGLDRYQDEVYTVLWHAPGGGFPSRTWFTLQVQVQGDTFTVAVDGQTLATVQDPAFSEGGVGFYAWAEGGAYFDNVVVTR